ncbi:MAG: DUF4124 domain-containing protein [Wenzhouxiangella sp.]
MKFRRLLIAAIALTALSNVEAQTVYRWVDEDGEVHYGHSVPPEYADQGYEVLRRDGTVRERVEPALSPEELAKRREQRRHQEEEEARRRNQESQDRLLLATYRNLEDLEAAMEAQIMALNSQRASIRTAIAQVERRFEMLVDRAAEHSRNNRDVPRSLEESIAKSRAELRRLRSDLAAIDEREAHTRERFRADFERYRELTGNGH